LTCRYCLMQSDVRYVLCIDNNWQSPVLYGLYVGRMMETMCQCNIHTVPGESL